MTTNKEWRITALLVLDTVFFLLEAIIGYTVHLLALIADLFHMLNDIISLVIALWAVRVKNTKKADDKYTYGWQRAEILGALINAVFLLALCFLILMEALARLYDPPIISNPYLILVVGCAGLALNMVGLVLFHEHGHLHGHLHNHLHSDVYEHGNGSGTNVNDYLPETVVDRVNLTLEESPLLGHSHLHVGELGLDERPKKKLMNMEGVFLHVLGDALGNIGVIITALFIWKTDLLWKYYADPVTSLVITAIIFSLALPLCRKALKILLQATPPNVDLNAILQKILQIPQVKLVHDFHIWNLNEDILIALLHLQLVDDCAPGELNQKAFTQVVGSVREILHRYGVHLVTVQPEFADISLPATELADSYGQSHKGVCAVDEMANCDTTNCK